MVNSAIRKQRELLGLTQTKLSFLSGVSLPTIQLIESGRGNPELETLERLLTALGLETQYVPKKANWEFLVLCGVPLTPAIEASKRSLLESPTKSRFVEEMRLAILESGSFAELAAETGEDERKSKAIAATLVALQTHYPSVYAEFSGSDIVKKLVNQKGLEKLRRIALAGMARFL